MNQFDKNKTDFPDFTRRSIWSNGLMLVPPEISFECIETEQQKIYIDLYAYKFAMYVDMYAHPGQYWIDADGIEKALNGRTYQQAHMSARWNKYVDIQKKLEELERVALPELICRQLLTYLTVTDGQAYMSRVDYDKFFVKSILKKNNYKFKEQEYLSMLARCGLTVTSTGEQVCFSNDAYPHMFAAIAAWQELLLPYKKTKEKYKYDSAFNHLDYRFFSPEHSITYENSKWYMNDGTTSFMDRLVESLSKQEKKFTKVDNTLSIAIGTTHKGKSIEFENIHTQNTLRIKLCLTGTPAQAKLEAHINALPNADEVKAYIIKHIMRCNRCPCRPVKSAADIGRRYVVFGREMRLCGQYLVMATSDLSDRSLSIIKNILELED